MYIPDVHAVKMAERELMIGGRRLSQLKVDELKVELERRGLKKSGNKGVLIERLQEALDKELEMSDSYGAFSVQPSNQMQAATKQTAKTWEQTMISPQTGSCPVQPTKIQLKMVEQSPAMMNQERDQLKSPVQVTGYEESLRKAEGHKPQMQYHQPQQQGSQRIPEQKSSTMGTDVITSSSDLQANLVQPVAQDVESSSSSPSSDQKVGEQTSPSLSDQDNDSDEQQPRRDCVQLTSPLNQSTSKPPDSSVVPDEEQLPSEESVVNVEKASTVEKKFSSKCEGENIEEEKGAPEEQEKENFMHSTSQGDISEALQMKSSQAEENTFEVEPSEDDKAVVEEPKLPIASTPNSPVITKKRKISLPRTSLPSTPSSDGQPGSRKRRWGSSSSSKKKSSVPISTDSLKDLIPGVQLHSTPALEAVMDLGEDDNDEEDEDVNKNTELKEEEEPAEKHGSTQSANKEEGKKRRDRIVKVEEKKTFKLQRKTIVVENTPDEQDMEVDKEPVIQVTDNPHPRHASLSTQEASSPVPAERSPSPAVNPPSKVLHLRNLVRPFTLGQLKDLLGKHGTLTDDGFWIDKIKSHCYVVYQTVEEASASRQALHGVKWPLTSPKILSVDFADEEEMSRDTGELLGKSKELEKNAKSVELIQKQDRVQPKSEKEEGEEQKNPGNLLDNLFRKTTTTPCLYWLPLTDEQIATREREREQRRKQRQDERDKEEEERKERQQQREKEREKEREKRETEKPRSRSPRDRKRERSRSRSRGGPRRR